MQRHILLDGCSLCILTAALTPSAAIAQSTDGSAVQEIVVTAQRRSENVQDVPVSISVVTSDQIAARGIRDTGDLTQLVSGLNFTSFTTQATPVIRGIGTNVLAQGDENVVAIYVDGIYQQTPNTAIFNLTDVERIEVLKGPQGTLFGRNAVAGVINVTTITPSAERRADFSLSYGNLNTVTATGLIVGGVSDDLATSLSGYYNRQGDGLGKNLFNGADIYQGWQLALRNKWHWTPTDRTSVTVIGAYNKSRNDNVCFRLVEDELGQDGRTTHPGFYNINADGSCFVKSESFDAGLIVEQDLSFAKLISNTGYNRVTGDRPGDSDNTPTFIQNSPFVHQTDRGWTQELQLQSKGSEAFKWTVGYFHFSGKSGYPDPGLVVVPNSPTIAFTQIRGFQKVESNAGFGQATLEVFSNTHLTAGARYTSDRRSIDANVERVFTTSPTPVVLASGNDSARFNKFTWRVSLDHQLTEQLLLYGNVGTGFKAGLYNLPSPSDPVVKPENLTAYEVGFKSTLLNRRLQFNGAAYYYEYSDLQVPTIAVINGVPLSRVLNAADAQVKGFDFDVRAVPIDHLNVTAGLSYTHARYKSFPSAVTNIPDPTGVIVGGRPTALVFDAAGNALNKAPDWTYNLGADYTLSAGSGEVTFAANLSYMSHFYWNAANSFREPSKTLVNVSIDWAINDNYNVIFWGRNLLDEKYQVTGVETARGLVGTPSLPLTFGGTVRAKF